MARKRVIPPSTRSSNTTSAFSSPLWGRAAGEFSILRPTAGRAASTPLGSSMPLRHAAATVGLPSESSAGEVVDPSSPPSPLHAAATTPSARPAATTHTALLSPILEGSLHFAPRARNELNPNRSGRKDHSVTVPRFEGNGVF